MKRETTHIWMSLLALCAACTSSRETVPLDRLTGGWEAEFLPSEPGRHSVQGLVALDSIVPEPAECPPYLGECGAVVRGTHTIDLKPLLGHDLPPDVTAGLDGDRMVVVVLGGCCDRGELSARGRLENGKIRGRWEETYVGGGRSGSFVLTKIRAP